MIENTKIKRFNYILIWYTVRIIISINYWISGIFLNLFSLIHPVIYKNCHVNWFIIGYRCVYIQYFYLKRNQFFLMFLLKTHFCWFQYNKQCIVDLKYFLNTCCFIVTSMSILFFYLLVEYYISFFIFYF